jgi:preprotein translocase subunit SecF
MTATTIDRPKRGRVRRFIDGESHVDFIGRSRMWLILAAVSLTICALAVGIRNLNFGIDFTGGTSMVVENATASFTADDIRDALGELGVDEAVVQVTADGTGALISTTALGEIAGAQQREVVDRLAEVTGAGRDQIEVSAIGPRWGQQISRQALRGLAVFLLLVTVYISVRFEWRMGVAALATLVHDLLITVGIYALFGFQVTPASVIALLSILGFSLYDPPTPTWPTSRSTACWCGRCRRRSRRCCR